MPEATPITSELDADGLTQGDVAKLGQEQEFDLAIKRADRAGEILEQSQNAIDRGSWHWIGSGISPNPAPNGVAWDYLKGANGENSYYIMLNRAHFPSGAKGERSDLDPVRRYFESKAWTVTETEISGSFYLRAMTKDGYQVEYLVQKNGQYSLEVASKLFWSNDSYALGRSVALRQPRDFPETSLPSVREKLPSWDDPVIPLSS
ncbi:hypothetical protein [Galactobacter caseinivorans]|uniref:hypothetical protein n=1 Tax=Galactobacter caseinivorans TaxID=2676123 RepID=UPI0011C43A90|nr:hypothetical protein [Galactobacter caseinivorans]